MDTINHIIIGVVLGKITHTPLHIALILSIIPDIAVVIWWLYIGKNMKRFLWIPKNEDWEQWYKKNKWISQLYYFLHSFISLIIYIPLVYFLPLSWWIILVYPISHIFFDIITHKGIWSLQPFYPLYNTKIEWIINARSLSRKNWLLLNVIIWILAYIWYVIS